MESLGRALAVNPSVEYWERLKACWLDAWNAGEEDGAALHSRLVRPGIRSTT